MSTTKKSNGLSWLDWFGIVTGGIGLIADGISLSALFSASNRANQSENVSAWLIISFLAIIYTIGMVGFFSRRFFVTRNSKRQKRSRTKANFYKIVERSTLILCLLIGLPLIMAYLVSVFTLFPDAHIFPVGAFSLPRPLTEGLYHGLFIGLFICFVINWITKVIFQAYAPEYHS